MNIIIDIDTNISLSLSIYIYIYIYDSDNNNNNNNNDDTNDDGNTANDESTFYMGSLFRDLSPHAPPGTGMLMSRKPSGGYNKCNNNCRASHPFAFTRNGFTSHAQGRPRTVFTLLAALPQGFKFFCVY